MGHPKTNSEPTNGRVGLMTRKELLHLTGWSATAINGWVERGCLVKTGPGVYDGDRTLRRVLDWYEQERRTLLGGSDPATAQSTSQERHAAAAAQRKINEIKLARMEGSSFDMADIKAMWGSIMVAVRQMVLAIPARAAAELPHLTRHDLTVMERECGEILKMNSLANPEHGPLPEPSEARA